MCPWQVLFDFAGKISPLKCNIPFSPCTWHKIEEGWGGEGVTGVKIETPFLFSFPAAQKSIKTLTCDPRKTRY